MNIIFKIARAELRTLFFSPIAWFVVFLFYITCAAVFTLTMEGTTIVQEVMMELDPKYIGSPGLGRGLAESILGKMMQYIYLFIPLLTMGIINREVNSGTIKLLYSSPVTTKEIILGKYLGLVFFNLLLLFIFSIMLVSIYFTIENVEYYWYLSILLGLFLLVNTYGAIGLFISCLTTYQIVAAMITFTVFIVLKVIGSVWQQYDLIRDITYYLSIGGKAELMMNGMITTRDVIYFLLIIGLFIGFAMIKLQGTQKTRRWTTAAAQYTGLLLIVITIGYLTSRPGYIGYADLTKNKINTIHPAIQQIIKELDGSPLTVTLYTNLLDRNAMKGLPQNRNEYIWKVWEPFIRFYPNLQFKYEYYYDTNKGDSSLFKQFPGKSIDEIRDIVAEILGIRPSIFTPPQEIRKKIDLEPESKQLVMLFEYNNKKTFLRTYADTKVWPDPEHFAGAFKRLTRKEDVRIGFVTGHYERDAIDYAPRHYGGHLTAKKNRMAMINLGADTDTLSLSDAPVPEYINTLVVADPKTAYSETELGHIRDYIQKGGNTIFLAENEKQSLLDPLLHPLGVHLDKGMIVQQSKHEMPHIFKNLLTKAGNFLAKEKEMQLFQDYGIKGGSIHNEGTINISYEEIDGFKIEPVVTMPGNDKTWIENGILVVDSAAPVFNPAEGDIRKNEYVLAIKLSRKVGNKEQKIFVAGDGDIWNGRRFSTGTAKHAFYSWELNNEYPVYTNFPLSPDKFILISNKSAKVLTTIYLYIGSAVVLLCAIVLLVRRKRK